MIYVRCLSFFCSAMTKRASHLWKMCHVQKYVLALCVYDVVYRDQILRFNRNLEFSL